VLLSLTSACIPHIGARDRPCELSPAAGTPFDSTRAGELQGEYDLILVSTWASETGESLRGRLHLEPTDTLHRFHERSPFGSRPVSARPLWGWAAFPPPHINVPWGADPASHDPDHPGVLVHAPGHIELGVWRGLDGSSVTLRVERVTPAGFSGRWGSDLGDIRATDENGRVLPNPNGYFCALRR
jgi:hypothetical protein